MGENGIITKAMADYEGSVRLEAKRLSNAIDDAVFKTAVESFGLDAVCDKHITKSDNLIMKSNK